MDDVLDSHAERGGGSGGGRRGTAIGVAALLVVAGVVVASRADSGRRPDALPGVSASPSPSPTEEPEEPEPLPLDGDVVHETPAPGPTRIDAAPWTGSRQSLLVVESGKLVRLRPGARRTTLTGVDWSSALVPVRGGTIVFSHGSEPGARNAVKFVRTGGDEAVMVGWANAVAVASDGATVWLAEPDGPAKRFVARRVDPATGRVRERVTLPEDTALAGAVSNGLLLRVGFDVGGYDVWDPRTRRTVRMLTGGVAVNGGRYAVVSSVDHCIKTCHTIVDVVTGKEWTAPDLAWGSPPVLSPDGRRLAMLAQLDDRAHLLVYDRVTGETTRVEGTALSLDALGGAVWSRDSRTVYVSFRTITDAGDSGQVVSWRMGDPSVRVVLDAPVEEVAPE